MSSVLRRGELLKLGRLLGRPPESLDFAGGLDVGELRQLRDAISARLFDDARPMLQRVATGSRLLPNALTAKVGETVFGATLCAQIAGLLATPHALDLALRMSDGFLAEVSAMIDPRRAGPVIAQIPTDRVVAVAHVMLGRRDYVTLARFVNYLSQDTIAAVIASIPGELDLLRIGAYVECPQKLGELVGNLAPERTRAMIAALRGGDGAHWLEALAIAEQLDDRWRALLGDHAAALDTAVLEALAEAAHRYDAWPAALRLVFAMRVDGQRRFLELPMLATPDVVHAILVAVDQLDRWDAFAALAPHAPATLRAAFTSRRDRAHVPAAGLVEAGDELAAGAP